MRRTVLIATVLLMAAPAAQARHYHYGYGRVQEANQMLLRPHHHRIRYVDPPIKLTTVEKAQEPARYKLVKVKAVAPLVLDRSLLFDPQPRLSVNHFSKEAPWAGSLDY